MDELLVKVFIESHDHTLAWTAKIILDVDMKARPLGSLAENHRESMAPDSERRSGRQ